ncbi:helix-turn-helix DNA-binding domain protein [Mycobacterium phage MrMiyagi]|uniref:Helix-turn-helix DNA binding domain protein n=1 Tax=Mycobacterium phage MrMiyagi TaxID=2762395 RepID=A0A7G8LPV9_9CAUD|nr:helix-turn-helix DNA-binding domain protein [Mycobacterium phage MrMiyagi]
MSRQKPAVALVEETDEQEKTNWKNDAAEFGRHFKQGGWRLGLLVARNCLPSVGGRPTNESQNRPPVDSFTEKTSIREFAEIAGVSKSTVAYYYKAWELAADAGLVLHASELNPGDDDSGVSELEEDNEDDEERREKWKVFYRQARNGEKKKAEPKAEAKPRAEEKKPDRLPVSSEGDESDSDVDELDQITPEQIAELDSANRKAEILERLESLRAVDNWLKSFGPSMNSEETRLIGEIGFIALDLNTMAKSSIAGADDSVAVAVDQ